MNHRLKQEPNDGAGRRHQQRASDADRVGDKRPLVRVEGLEEDGTTRIGVSEQLFAEQARAALTRNIPGVVFNEITGHRDGRGQLIKIEVDYMDEIHDPSSRTAIIDFRN